MRPHPAANLRWVQTRTGNSALSTYLHRMNASTCAVMVFNTVFLCVTVVMKHGLGGTQSKSMRHGPFAVEGKRLVHRTSMDGYLANAARWVCPDTH